MATPQYRLATIIPERLFAVRIGSISNCQALGSILDQAPASVMALSELSRAESGVMERNELLKKISIDPNVCFGKPCVRGHRIWVSLILDLLALGMTVEQVLEQYPQLCREDVLACVAYGAEMSRERFVEVPLERPA